MAQICVLQHIACETLGTIEQVLHSCGLTPSHVRAFAGDPVPKRLPRNVSGLIVMGGPMGVYEQARYPYLAAEMHLIDRALKDELPIFGTCLGSQLLATVLGAEVHRGEGGKEIGWHEVTLSELAAADAIWSALPAAGEDRFTAFHWHGDVFGLPAGAVQLAASERTPCQAFVHGRNAYGTLFHMEVTGKIVHDLVATFAPELVAEGVDGQQIIAAAADHLVHLQQLGRTVFEAWAGLALAHESA